MTDPYKRPRQCLDYALLMLRELLDRTRDREFPHKQYYQPRINSAIRELEFAKKHIYTICDHNLEQHEEIHRLLEMWEMRPDGPVVKAMVDELKLKP